MRGFIVVGFGIGLICPVGKTAGASVPATPPGWVFGVAWTILYITIGIAWVLAARVDRRYDWGFVALVAVLAAWVFVYSCRKRLRGGLYVIVASVLGTLILAFSLAAAQSQVAVLLAPLLAWLFFATLLNFNEVNSSPQVTDL